MKKGYKIEVDCPVCASKMETAAAKVPGVNGVVVNFMTLKMIVDFQDGVDRENVMEQISKVCKKVASDSKIYF